MLAIMKFIDTTNAHNTQNNEYKILAWCYGGGIGIGGLMVDDNGVLYTAQNMQDPTVWTIVHI